MALPSETRGRDPSRPPRHWGTYVGQYYIERLPSFRDNDEYDHDGTARVRNFRENRALRQHLAIGDDGRYAERRRLVDPIWYDHLESGISPHEEHVFYHWDEDWRGKMLDVASLRRTQRRNDYYVYQEDESFSDRL